MPCKYNHIDAAGKRQEIELEVTAYADAAELGLSLSQYLERKYPSHPESGSTFSQLLQSSGMFLRYDPQTGLAPPTMKEVLETGMRLDAGAIVRPDGADRGTPSGRLLFPEVVLQLIQQALTEDKTDFLGGYESMIALTQPVNSPRFDQPRINTTGPEGDRSGPIGQLAEPAMMTSITLSETTRNIPTKAMGLTISDQALAATTLDLVGLIMTAQARGERISLVEGQLSDMVNGNTDLGISALASVTAKSFDATIAADGDMTQKAWIHWLRANYRKMAVTHIVTDVDSALAIEGRTGKPTVATDDPKSPRIDSLFTVENLGITPPRVLLVESSMLGAYGVVGLDSRWAIRRVINVSAAYSAVESYVMRRATSFRVDYGEIAHRLYDDAWTKLRLETT